MSSKLRIRIGEVEIEYEGTEDFLKQELPSLLKTAMELHKAADKVVKTGAGGSNSDKVPALTTASIAAKLNSTSGSDLIVAAAAHLTFVAKKATFSRAELLTAMQGATGYYKNSYSKNLTKYLTSALTEQLTETATDVYALSAKTRAELEVQLAHS